MTTEPDHDGPDPAWQNVATAAFHAAYRGDHNTAARHLVTLDQYDAIAHAMLAWIDTTLAHAYGVTDFIDGHVGLKFGALQPDGSIAAAVHADGTQPPDVVWAGRVLAARAAGDEDTYRALVAAAPEDDFGMYVFRLLTGCALAVRRATEAKARLS